MCQRDHKRSKSRLAGYPGSKGRVTGREKLLEWEKVLREREREREVSAHASQE